MSRFFKNIKMDIGAAIWNTSERLRIPLGKYAPIVFGWMMGVKGERVDDNKK